MYASRECVGHRTQNLLVLRPLQLSYISTICTCGHGSVQMVCGLLACKQSVNDAISVKKIDLVIARSTDLLRYP